MEQQIRKESVSDLVVVPEQYMNVLLIPHRTREAAFSTRVSQTDLNPQVLTRLEFVKQVFHLNTTLRANKYTSRVSVGNIFILKCRFIYVYTQI